MEMPARWRPRALMSIIGTAAGDLRVEAGKGRRSGPGGWRERLPSLSAKPRAGRPRAASLLGCDGGGGATGSDVETARSGARLLLPQRGSDVRGPRARRSPKDLSARRRPPACAGCRRERCGRSPGISPPGAPRAPADGLSGPGCERDQDGRRVNPRPVGRAGGACRILTSASASPAPRTKSVLATRTTTASVAASVNRSAPKPTTASVVSTTRLLETL